MPDIAQKLYELKVPFKLNVAGKGVHAKYLKKKFNDYINKGIVEFVGSLAPLEIPNFLAETDVLLFPSRFEGCPNALLEGMMAGSVPVSSHLNGITDFIIQDRVTGFLCPIGDYECFAARISDLVKNRQKLREMSQNVSLDARKRFSSDKMALQYARVFKKFMATPAPKWVPQPWSRFKEEPSLSYTYRKYFPKSIKKWLRRMMFYIGASKRYE